jgi:hypothetical protein
MTTFPPAPPEEEARDACCEQCGSLFHTTDGHGRRTAAIGGEVSEFPPGYDPGEADRLIGRDAPKRHSS